MCTVTYVTRHAHHVVDVEGSARVGSRGLSVSRTTLSVSRKCVIRGAPCLGGVSRTRTGGHTTLGGCHEPSDGCTSRRRKGHDSVGCLSYFFSIKNQRIRRFR
jgi:hypothetical protein